MSQRGGQKQKLSGFSGCNIVSDIGPKILCLFRQVGYNGFENYGQLNYNLPTTGAK